MDKQAGKKIDGAGSQISYDGRQLCHIGALQNVYCANSSLHLHPNWRFIQGPMKYVDVHDDYIFGISPDDGIYVTASRDTTVFTTQLHGALSQISYDGRHLCGVNKQHKMYCADSDLTTAPNWKYISEKYKYVVVEAGTLFALDLDGNIFAGMPIENTEWTFVGRQVTQFTFEAKMRH